MGFSTFNHNKGEILWQVHLKKKASLGQEYRFDTFFRCSQWPIALGDPTKRILDDTSVVSEWD